MTDRRHSEEPIDVLLVEDNPGDIRLTREAFKEGQVDTTLYVVTNGVEALDFLHQRGEHADAPLPDIVLLDLNLPRKDGDEVLEAIRGELALERLPVIVLTSSEAETDIVQSYELDANAFLTKPVDPEEFIDAIRSLEEFWLSVAHLPPDDQE